MKNTLLILGLIIGFSASAQWSTSNSNFYTYGRVSIGNAGFSKNFSVEGNSMFNMSASGVITLFRSTSNTWNSILIENRSGIGNAIVYGQIKVESGQVEIGSKSNHPVHIGAGDNKSHISVLPNGNVGIGQESPDSDSKLWVKNDDRVGILSESVYGSSGGYGFLSSFPDRQFKAFVALNRETDEEVFVVKGDGHVYAQEITVALAPFPDYVFESEYKLMSINQVEDYISINSHLPNIPSAKEIEKNGIGVGELQTLQMEKIEELTLYIIQLQKQIDELNKKIK